MTAMTLTEFLLARIGEDEAAARDALEQGREPEPEPWLAVGWPASEHPGPVVLVGPERFLADCEAKRRIVEEHRGGKWPNPPDPCDAHDASFVSTPCDTLRHLAAIYADHPDYDEAWRP